MPRKPSISKDVFQAPVVEVVPAEGASVLRTFGEDWPGWRGGKAIGGIPGPFFLRLRPPADVPASTVEFVRSFYRDIGWSVKVELAQRADVVPRGEAPRLERPHARAREVVEGLLLASRSESREELAEFVRAKMEEAKL